MNMKLISIGVIETPYKSLEQCPDNVSADGPVCEIQLKPEYQRLCWDYPTETNYCCFIGLIKPTETFCVSSAAMIRQSEHSHYVHPTGRTRSQRQLL